MANFDNEYYALCLSLDIQNNRLVILNPNRNKKVTSIKVKNNYKGHDTMNMPDLMLTPD